MLTRTLRLPRPAVAATVATGRAYRAERLGLRVRPTPALATRLALVVAGKQVRLAVRRQAIKRKLRAALHDLRAGLLAGYQIVIFANRRAEAATFQDLKTELTTLLRQTGVLK